MKEKINQRYEKLSEIENYKQLNEDLESGKSFILDYKNNSIECDKFGIPVTKFYRNRRSKNLKNEKFQYVPMTSHILGSSMFPNPLSIPFINQIKNSKKLIDTINKEELFNLKKNKYIFNLKSSRNNKSLLPDFFCVKLGKDGPQTRNHLINLIDANIKIIKNENNDDPKYYLKNSKFIGLSNHKKYLKNNLTKNLYNGNKVSYPKQKEIFTKFRIIKRLIKKEGWNKMHIISKNINHDIYSKLYKIISMDNKNNLFKKNHSLNISFENEKRENSNLNIEGNYNDISSYPRKINKYKNNISLNALVSPRNRGIKDKMNSRQKNIYVQKRNIYSSFRNESKNKLASFKTIEINASNNSWTKENKRELYSPRIFHKFKKCISNLNIENNNFKKIKINENNTKELEENKSIMMPFLSFNKEINNSKNIRKLNEILKKCEHENKLIKGYESAPETEELEETGFKKRPPKFVSPIAIYKKEKELFKKVNPRQWDKILKKQLFDDKMLLRKLEHRKILQNIKLMKK